MNTDWKRVRKTCRVTRPSCQCERRQHGRDALALSHYFLSVFIRAPSMAEFLLPSVQIGAPSVAHLFFSFSFTSSRGAVDSSSRYTARSLSESGLSTPLRVLRQANAWSRQYGEE